MAQTKFWTRTVSEWLEQWLEDWMLAKKASTVRGYRSQCRTNITPYIGDIPICELGVEDINRLYKTLSKGKGLAPKSVRNVHGILHEALAIAYELEGIPKNPADCRHIIQLPKVVKEEIRPLTHEQIQDFLDLAKDDQFENYYKLLLFTGMRESEALGLTWDCVDLISGQIRIEKQLQKRKLSEGGYCFAPLKNNRARTISIGTAVADILRAERKNQMEARQNTGLNWKSWTDETSHRSAPLVFTTCDGRYLSHTTVRRHYKAIVQKLEIPSSRVHDLRHTYAVLSLQNGDDIKTVQENLGHATAAFTLDVYGHVLDRMKVASAARMDQYIVSVSNGGKNYGKSIGWNADYQYLQSERWSGQNHNCTQPSSSASGPQETGIAC